MINKLQRKYKFGPEERSSLFKERVAQLFLCHSRENRNLFSAQIKHFINSHFRGNDRLIGRATRSKGMCCKLYFLLIVSLCFPSELFPQSIRSMAMGGMDLAVIDKENSFNPFYLGGNPSWMYESEKESWLKIVPSIINYSGDYRRIYTPQSSSLYGMEFKGVKTLGTSGTFLGSTSYTYDNRKNVYRSLEYNPYAGESFFFTDTTNSDVTYDGPRVEFMYSWELLPNLFAGASASYSILKGLKKQYTYAETTLRQFGGNVGLTYKLMDNLVFGLNARLNDSQEKITSQDVNLMDVEIFYYRGETHSIYKRSASEEEKLRTKGNTFSSQVYWLPDEFSEVGLTADYSKSNINVLIPYSVSSTESYDEYQDGYSSFNNYNLCLKGRYELKPSLIAGLAFEYSNMSSWSEYVPKDLLLWEWKIKRASVGFGMSYNFTQSLLGGFEYRFSRVDADSSKYIDGRTASITSNDHLIKIGLEYLLFTNLKVQAGYNYGLLGRDITGGGKNVSYNILSAGAAIDISDLWSIDALIGYSNLKPDNNSGLNRTGLTGLIVIKLNSF